MDVSQPAANSSECQASTDIDGHPAGSPGGAGDGVIDDIAVDGRVVDAAAKEHALNNHAVKSEAAAEASRVDVAELIDAHQASVWRYLRVLGCDPSLADDLTQDTFLAILTRPFQYIDENSTLKYLRTVARNLLISRHRRETRYRFQAEVEHIELIWDRWTQNHGDDAPLDALRECLTRLRDKAKLALTMRFRDRKSRKEIAEAVNMSEHGAKNLMQRAKKVLKDCVERRIK